MMRCFAIFSMTLVCISAGAQAPSYFVNGYMRALGKTIPYTQPFSTFKTDSDSSTTVVFSNGLSVYIAPQSEMEVHVVMQEELQDTYAAAEYEKRPSYIVLELKSGTFGFAQPEPDPTSTLEVRTRYGIIEGDATQFAVTLEPDDYNVASLQGTLYFKLEDGTSRFVSEGDALNIREAAIEKSIEALTKMRATGRLKYEPLVQHAQVEARRTLFLKGDSEPRFDTVILPRDLKGTAYNEYLLH